MCVIAFGAATAAAADRIESYILYHMKLILFM